MVSGLPRTTGFTLLELMVVVAIVAVLAVVAAPALSSMIKGTQIKGVASSLHMSLVRARSEAVKRNVPVNVTRNGGGGGSWNMGWDVVVSGGGPVLEQQPAQEGVTIESDEADPDDPQTITYLGSGRVQGNLDPVFTVDADPPFKTASDRNNRCRRIRLGTSGIPTVTPLTCPVPP